MTERFLIFIIYLAFISLLFLINYTNKALNNFDTFVNSNNFSINIEESNNIKQDLDIFMQTGRININLTKNPSQYYNFVGSYYRKQENYGLMEIYYKYSIDLNNTNAMINLGNYYESINNYQLAEFYYFKAVFLNDTKANHNLGMLYFKQQNYSQMVIYLKNDINNSNSMNYVGQYYRSIYNISEMKHYLKLAVKLNNTKAMSNLAHYYYNIKNYDQMKYYFNKAIKHGDLISMFELGLFYEITNDNILATKYYELFMYYYSNSKAVKTIRYSEYQEYPEYSNIAKYIIKYFRRINTEL